MIAHDGLQPNQTGTNLVETYCGGTRDEYSDSLLCIVYCRHHAVWMKKVKFIYDVRFRIHNGPNVYAAFEVHDRKSDLCVNPGWRDTAVVAQRLKVRECQHSAVSIGIHKGGVSGLECLVAEQFCTVRVRPEHLKCTPLFFSLSLPFSVRLQIVNKKGCPGRDDCERPADYVSSKTDPYRAQFGRPAIWCLSKRGKHSRTQQEQGKAADNSSHELQQAVEHPPKLRPSPKVVERAAA